MKKTIITLLLLVACAGSTFAQFEKEKKYIGASLSSAGISYSDTEEFAFGLDFTGGYMFTDDWMLLGEVGFDYKYSDLQNFYLGAKVRYYIEQNGLFLGTGMRYLHLFKDFNDFQLTPEVGYCFFLGKYATIEPALFYDMSLSDFAHKSKAGLKIGFGFYF